jgi:DNA-binding transcriptional LysR family regulator
VVQPFSRQQVGLYASDDYVARFGLPASVEEFHRHRFIGSDFADSRAPFYRWLRQNVPAENIVFRLTDDQNVQEAVLAGAGIGFLSAHRAAHHGNLQLVMEAREDWTAPLWLVTHVDLHRSTKVQAFLSFLKQHAQDQAWG